MILYLCHIDLNSEESNIAIMRPRFKCKMKIDNKSFITQKSIKLST